MILTGTRWFTTRSRRLYIPISIIYALHEIVSGMVLLFLQTKCFPHCATRVGGLQLWTFEISIVCPLEDRIVYAYLNVSKALTRFIGVLGSAFLKANISPTGASAYVVGWRGCGARAARDGGTRVVVGG